MCIWCAFTRLHALVFAAGVRIVTEEENERVWSGGRNMRGAGLHAAAAGVMAEDYDDEGQCGLRDTHTTV